MTKKKTTYRRKPAVKGKLTAAEELAWALDEKSKLEAQIKKLSELCSTVDSKLLELTRRKEAESEGKELDQFFSNFRGFSGSNFVTLYQYDGSNEANVSEDIYSAFESGNFERFRYLGPAWIVSNPDYHCSIVWVDPSNNVCFGQYLTLNKVEGQWFALLESMSDYSVGSTLCPSTVCESVDEHDQA